MACFFFCLSVPRILISLLLMVGNVHPNPHPVFPCLVCAEYVTWRCRLLQWCTCFKWVYLRCSLLSSSKFNTQDSSHSWSCPLFYISASPVGSQSSNTVTSSKPPQHVHLHCKSGLLCKCSATTPPLPTKNPNSLPPLSDLSIFTFPTLRFWLLFYTSSFLFLP